MQVSPEDFERDFGGVEALDLTVRVMMQGLEEARLIFHEPDGRGVYTQWPDPAPGTTVEAEPVPDEPFTHVVTVRDYPVERGSNRIRAVVEPKCSSSLGRELVYFQFSNGEPFTPTPRPDSCGGLGLGPDAEVIAFNSGVFAGEDVEGEYGVNFENTVIRERPENVEPRSGRSAARSRYEAFEFGSSVQGIRMNFRREGTGLRALGMFVGLDEATLTSGEVTAQLTVYGYSEGSDELSALGSASTSFPAEPTDIKECLRFEADEGDIIARAVLDFLDESGLPIFEDRWMDDLTLVYGEERMPPNAPPFIEILRPADGAVVVGDVPVRAEIQEDVGLAGVRYRVDGGDWTEVGFNPLAGEPDLYRTGVTLGLSHETSHVITMQAEDVIGQTWEDHVTVNVATPIPTLDIEVVDAEIVQVVQCMRNSDCEDNSVPLLSGKPTLVRLYLRATGGPAEGPISGRLCRGTGSTCDTAFVRALNQVVPDDDVDPVRSDRGDIDATLNFMLPPAWVDSSRTLRLTVHANYEGENLAETSFDNNRLEKTIEIQPARTMNVQFSSMENQGSVPPLSARWDLIDWLARVYPVSEVNVRVAVPNVIIGGYDLTDTRGDGCDRGWNRLLDVLRANYFWSGPGKAHLYGMVDGATETGNYVGCGARPGKVAAGIVTADRTGAEIAAQELGHNLARRHPTGCDAGNTDGSYPESRGNLDAWGVDVGRLQIYPPGSSFDFMGYCGGEGDTWVSAYTYRALMRKLDVAAAPGGFAGLAAPQRAEHETYLVGTGFLTATSFDLESGFFRVDLPVGTSDRLPSGAYEVRLYGADGELLHQRDFGLFELSNEDTTSEGGVLLALPAPEGVQEIALFFEGTQIESITPSSSPPEVSLLTPSGGETWGDEGARTIEWEASDPDGDDLSFNVQYSQDGGETWRSLAPQVRGATSIQVEVASFPGGGTQFRVLASDGFHTGVAQAGGSVDVARKPPQIHLALPEDGETYPAGEAVVFRGFAADLEDRVLEGSSFAWSSEVDGELGRGKTLWGIELTPGEHVVTLTVTDSDGMSASQSVQIEVLARPEAVVDAGEAAPPVSPLLTVLVLGGLGLLGLAGATMIFLAWRKKV